jgi:hypothetical protein
MTEQNRTELAYTRGQLEASLSNAQLTLNRASSQLTQLIRESTKMNPEQITTTLCSIEGYRQDLLVALQLAMKHLKEIIRLTPEPDLPVHCSPYALRKGRGISLPHTAVDPGETTEETSLPFHSSSTANTNDKPL